MKTRLALVGALALGLFAAPARAGTDWASRLPDPEREATQKLQQYLRLDTTNPPGHEAIAVDLLARWLRTEGIPVTIYPSTPGRANLVARLKGRTSKPGLMLMHHMDVVEADARRWKVPPFSGLLRDGAIWGRGAIDMKGMGIMELVSFLALKRLGVPLERDVIYCAVADEEGSSEAGAGWLVKHHPEAVRCAEMLNEGSFGATFDTGAKVVGIQTAERGSLWLRLVATGEAGHGSVPHPDSATQRLIRALERLEDAPPDLALTPETRAMLPALAQSQRGYKRWVLSSLTNPLMLKLVGPMAVKAEPFLGAILSTTMNPTVLAAGAKVNVVPHEAVAQVDVRILPGASAATTRERVRRLLADPAIRIETTASNEPTTSPLDGRLYGLLRDAVTKEYPDVTVVPLLSTGTTDSAFFRPRGVQAYGLIPILAPREQIETMHGDNERITPAQLAAGTRVVFRTVVGACGNP